MSNAMAKARNPEKLANAVAFEKKLGVAAYKDARAMQAADAMIAGLTRAMVPAFDQANAEHQAKYATVFGRDAAGGAWSAGQVGNDFATVLAATTQGNLREKMTAVYNAGLSSFKTEVLNLIDHELWGTVQARGLDTTKLKRRKHQLKFNPGAKDLYRDPGNPLDRKHLRTFQQLGTTRIKQPDDQQQSARTVGDLAADGIGLSEREKRFMYPDQYANASWWQRLWGTQVKNDEQLHWKEGGSLYRPNVDNKWVKKVQEKLHMPVICGPSGTALRLFQAWEFLNKPAIKEELRLALLGWMITSNDHSFHEIMLTSAEYGMPYEPGVMAYRKVAPLSEDELRRIASPQGFPDEENYKTDHMTPGADGSLNSVLVTQDQLDTFNHVLASSAHIWETAPPTGGQLAHAMAVLVYTDEGEDGRGTSAYKFINNVLKGKDNAVVMLYHLNKDPLLKAAYDANKFSIKQLVAEAKQHAAYMQEGLKLLKPYTGLVHRGYRTNTLPRAGEAWTERKFFSMSKRQDKAEPFMNKGVGKYHVLVTMQSVTGRDIADLSMFQEDEVIFPYGSSFSVATAPVRWPEKGAHAYQVTWTNHA